MGLLTTGIKFALDYGMNKERNATTENVARINADALSNKATKDMVGSWGQRSIPSILEGIGAYSVVKGVISKFKGKGPKDSNNSGSNIPTPRGMSQEERSQADKAWDALKDYKPKEITVKKAVKKAAEDTFAAPSWEATRKSSERARELGNDAIKFFFLRKLPVPKLLNSIH